MSEHRNDIGHELTDFDLTQIQGGGVWNRVERAGRWVKEKATDAWSSVTSPRAVRSYRAILDVLHASVAVVTTPSPTSVERFDEVIH